MPKSACCLVTLIALASCQSRLAESKKEPTAGIMTSSDDCPRDDNQIISLDPGVRVEMYQSIVPSDPQSANLPPDSPLSKKLNLTYVKIMTGSHAGEYCWASTANIAQSP